MEIQKANTLKGASRFGSCGECGKGTSDGIEMWRIQFPHYSMYLCEKCLKRVGYVLGKYAESIKE